jgi:hypothetical protein
VCVTKSLIGQGLKMEESVIQFYRVHTPIYTQSASYCSIEGDMHVVGELHAATIFTHRIQGTTSTLFSGWLKKPAA